MMYISRLHTTKHKDTLAKHVHLTKNVRACTMGHIQKEKSNKLLSEALNKTGSSCSEHSTRCGGSQVGQKMNTKSLEAGRLEFVVPSQSLAEVCRLAAYEQVVLIYDFSFGQTAVLMETEQT